MPSRTAPSFRRGSSTLDINDGDFEWLKGYLMREHSKQSMNTASLLAELPELPELEPEPYRELEVEAKPSRKSKTMHDEQREPASGPPKMVWGASLVLDHSDDENAQDEGAGKTKRRKIGWTNTEDLTILAAVRRIGTQWPRIASHLPGRTADAVRNRWHRLQKMHTLGDTEEGRSAIDSLLIASGVDPDWAPPEMVDATPETGGAAATTAAKEDASCVRGSDHGRSMWTAEEDAIIESGVARFGCKWRQIAALLHNRSDSSVRNRWMRLCKERGTGNAAPAPPAAAAVATPKPMSRLEKKASAVDALADVDAELSHAVSLLDAEGVPLGIDAPDLLVDLDAFVEAVAGVLSGDGITREELMEFEVDEATTAPLASAPPKRAAAAAERRSSGVLELYRSSSGLQVAAGVLAVAGVAMAVGYGRRRDK